MRHCYLVVALGVCSVLEASLTVGFAVRSEQYERNWPQWRGPAGNGLVLHGDPPLTWGEGRNVKWKVAVPGSGLATPIIWDNKVFVLSAVPVEGAESRLAFTTFCLNRQTGGTLWT